MTLQQIAPLQQRFSWTPLLAALAVLVACLSSVSAVPSTSDSLVEREAHIRAFSRAPRTISLLAAEIDVSSALRTLSNHATSPAAPPARFTTLSTPRMRTASAGAGRAGAAMHSVKLRSGETVSARVPLRTFAAPARSAFETLFFDANEAVEGEGELKQWLLHVRGPVTAQTISTVRAIYNVVYLRYYSIMIVCPSQEHLKFVLAAFFWSRWRLSRTVSST